MQTVPGKYCVLILHYVMNLCKKNQVERLKNKIVIADVAKVYKTPSVLLNEYKHIQGLKQKK